MLLLHRSHNQYTTHNIHQKLIKGFYRFWEKSGGKCGNIGQ